jgi:hypothetical protein
MLLALAAWLWPIGLGGRMPVGGDVTRFSIGLMAELGRAYREGRLPLWNDLWGYGFPGLAESQMGVYYPPHLVLYGLLPTEVAYAASLLLHTVWGALGTYWAARRFGAGRIGSALGGFAWAASGFFVIHLPHQWGYTVGSWMPWAWGLAWPLVREAASLKQVLTLAAVLALQILPGHFQLAFITEVGVLGLALWGLLERPAGGKAAVRAAAGIGLALLAVAPLDAMQLWPTYELARLAESRRDSEYLSGFAASPLHLVSYVAPGLFHRSPLWRPVAWDPFHTSPEEHMAYIGLVPLLLAAGELWRSWRREPAVRALGWLAVGSLVLSLGPYLPGFESLIQLPGFSFFRAPARWSLATELALALLAARGLSAVVRGDWQEIGGFLVGATLVATLLAASVAGLAELALRSLRYPASHALPSALEGLMAWTPWKGRAMLRDSLVRVQGPADDPLILAGLLRRGEDPSTARLLPSRRQVYVEELAPTALVAATLVLAGALGMRRRSVLVGGLLLVTSAELVAFGHLLRPVETGPIRSLVAQSPILSLMAQSPRGTRVADGQGNLAMIAGMAPLPPYRTLDRPVHERLTGALNEPPLVFPRRRFSVGRLLGIGLHVYAQIDVAPYLRGGVIDTPWSAPREIVDRELARWTYGSKGLAILGPEATDFRLWESYYQPTRGWFLPAGVPVSEELASEWVSLPWRSPTPGWIEVDVTADRPGSVLVTVLDDPEWQATWIARSGEPGSATEAVKSGIGEGWVVCEIPGPGPWTLRLTYRGRAAYRGLGVSIVSWMVWGSLFALANRRGHRRGEQNEPNGPPGVSAGDGGTAVAGNLREQNEPNDRDQPT